MSAAKECRQFVVVDRSAALARRPADWREASFVGETAAFSYRTVGHLETERHYQGRLAWVRGGYQKLVFA
ncbi:MAG TPA: hypothetical protein VH601_17120 [Bryobacteraceae bacterium]|jgi:hypothetical protein